MTAADLRDKAARLADQLAVRLAESGALRSPEWNSAVRRVPRHLFVPSYVEQRPDGTWRTVSRADDATRDEWLAAVYSDRPLTTALRTGAGGQPTPISSSSKPGLMIRMLETLELHDDHRVLEIGTGTGYNAGLLCDRLGCDQVASVDIEPKLVTAAHDRLADLGMRPTLAVADGADGLPEAAPFDRIIATCSVPSVPSAWVEQLSIHGRVLTDLKITGDAGNLIDLRATNRGPAGRFLPRWAGFMPLRPKTEPVAAAVTRLPRAVERLTDAPSVNPWWDHPVVWFLAALHLPAGITTGVVFNANRTVTTATTIDAADGSWAQIGLSADDEGLRQISGGGPDLWQAVDDAYELWHRLGEPGWDRFGLTVTDDEQRVWFDTPESRYTWPLPAAQENVEGTSPEANAARPNAG